MESLEIVLERAEKSYTDEEKVAIATQKNDYYKESILKLTPDAILDAVSDGNNIKNSKPDPEVFVKAAEMLGVPAEECLVVEDADAGIIAGRAGGMKTLSVNGAKDADYEFPNLANSIYELIKNI